jgi:hypothetical protein
MKPDMSSTAVGRRIRKVGELVRLCRALSIKPGSELPVAKVDDAAVADGASNVTHSNLGRSHAGEQKVPEETE